MSDKSVFEVVTETTVDGAQVGLIVPVPQAKLYCPDCGAGEGDGCWDLEAEGSCPEPVQRHAPAPPRPPYFWDDPETDATDFAHPAWWRGEERAVDVLVKEANEILDGKPVYGVAGHAGWQALKKRLEAIAKGEGA